MMDNDDATMGDDDALFADLRRIQRQTRCSDKLIKSVINAVGQHSGKQFKKTLYSFDKEAQKIAACTFIKLHGCKACNRHVFTPWDRDRTCPLCGGQRFDVDGRPKEVCYYLTGEVRNNFITCRCYICPACHQPLAVLLVNYIF